MNATLPIELNCTIEDILDALRNPETNTVRIRIEVGETELEYGEHEREAIWFAKDLRAGLTPDGWELIRTAAKFDGQFTAAELANALSLDDAQDVRHRMRALGRTGVYKEIVSQVHDDLPIRSRRVDGKAQYWVTEWWRRAIQRVDTAGESDV